MADNIEHIAQRLNFLKVPIDIVDPDQLEQALFQLLMKGEESNIVLLSLKDLLRARRNGEYRDYVQQAALVIPISKSIIAGIQFLHGKQAIRYRPFDFIISLLAMLERHEFSSYLLGSKKKILLQIEKNIRDTFPGLRIVGRFPSFRRQEENMIIEAIRKSSPSLLLVGKGVRGGERWIARNSANLGKGMRLWCSDIFEVFAKRRQHPSKEVFDLGLEWVGYCTQNPLKLLRVFMVIYYHILLVINKVSKKNDPQALNANQNPG